MTEFLSSFEISALNFFCAYLISSARNLSTGIAENRNAQVVNKPEKETNSDDGTTQLLHVNPEIKGIGISCRTVEQFVLFVRQLSS